MSAAARLPWGTVWQIARRDLNARFKGLRLLVLCIFLGTAALAAIGTLTAAIERQHEARILVAAAKAVIPAEAEGAVPAGGVAGQAAPGGELGLPQERAIGKAVKRPRRAAVQHLRHLGGDLRLLQPDPAVFLDLADRAAGAGAARGLGRGRARARRAVRPRQLCHL